MTKTPWKKYFIGGLAYAVLSFLIGLPLFGIWMLLSWLIPSPYIWGALIVFLVGDLVVTGFVVKFVADKVYRK